MLLKLFNARRGIRQSSMFVPQNEDFEIYQNPNLSLKGGALRVKRHNPRVVAGTYLSQIKIDLFPIHYGETIVGVMERLKWRNHSDVTILDALVRKISKQTRGAWAIPDEYIGKIVFFPATVFETSHGSKVAYLNGTKELSRLRYLYPEDDPINRNDAYVATLA